MSLDLDIELPDVIDIDHDVSPAEETLQYHSGVKKYVHVIVDAWFATPARIAATCVLVLACFALIYWNLDRLSILDELVELEVTEYRLDSQLNDLELELASIDVESLSNAIEAENDKVFQGFPELAAWAEGVAAVAAARAMVFSYQAKVPHLSPVPDVLEVPITLTFKAAPDSADNLFDQSMALIGFMLRDHWHMDVVETQASGGGEGLDAISIQAQVWVRDRYGFVDLAALQLQNSAEDQEMGELIEYE
ncbi:MAG: hypothetical protein ACFHXK_12270 [bacterium]